MAFAGRLGRLYAIISKRIGQWSIVFWERNMNLSRSRLRPKLCIAFVVVLCAQGAFAGVSRTIQDKYRAKYENKALFLKIPAFGERQTVSITGQTYRAVDGTGQARFKVGDQLRVLGIDFAGDEVKFKMGAISSAGFVEIVFKFDGDLQESFPNSAVFDGALGYAFTEGLKYTDLEEAKRTYTQDEFEQAVRQIAAASNTSREAVLKNIAPRVPAYEESQRQIESLKADNEEVSSQLSASQSENRKLDADLRNSQSEVARLRSQNTALQEKIDSSTSQLSKLGEDLRAVRGATQGYQKELASIQRSLNLKVGASEDLVTQISELGQAMRKLQKDNEGLEGQNSALRSDLEEQQMTNNRLSREIDDLKASNKQMSETIQTLTSKEDSLARQYIDLKKTKENLEDVVQSVSGLSARVAEEKTGGGNYYRKVNIYLKNLFVGTLDWLVPLSLSHNSSAQAKAVFTTESIDYVKISPEERKILRSLGDKLRIQAMLSSSSPTMEVRDATKLALHEVGERDRAEWNWTITNRGTQDARLLFAVKLINKNSDPVTLIQDEPSVMSSNVVREVRNYLQPVPLAVGILIGFLFFGVVGIFRRVRVPESIHRHRSPGSRESDPFIHRKQL
jgi:predicted nuclease with TOPRIM domain